MPPFADFSVRNLNEEAIIQEGVSSKLIYGESKRSQRSQICAFTLQKAAFAKLGLVSTTDLASHQIGRLPAMFAFVISFLRAHNATFEQTIIVQTIFVKPDNFARLHQ